MIYAGKSLGLPRPVGEWGKNVRSKHLKKELGLYHPLLRPLLRIRRIFLFLHNYTYVVNNANLAIINHNSNFPP